MNPLARRLHPGLWFGSLLLLLISATAMASEASRDARGKHGMVASAHPLASQVGVDILKAGGNAVDAAVAVGFALGVVEPNASGLGGGGFMLIWLKQRSLPVYIDFRGKAPSGTTPDMFVLNEDDEVTLDKRGFNPAVIGGKSVAVPGEVAGLLLAQEEFGRLNRRQVMKPAIDHAEDGVVVSEVLSAMMTDHYDALSSHPETAAIYLNDDFPRMPGEKVVNRDLAKTLRMIADQGRDAFYTGPVARSIVQAVRASGGTMTQEDIEGFLVSYRRPVTGSYRGYDIISAPPPSSGGVHVIELLNIMEHYDVAGMGLNTAPSLHLWAEAMKLVYADRARFMGDADYVLVPVDALASKAYARQRRALIDPDRAAERFEAGNPTTSAAAGDSGSTTHFSVVDADGNMVACTKTINHFFGSGITAPGTGVLLNDQMDDFDKRPGLANSIEPGKKPLSSMSPVLLMKTGRPFATLGSPGGKRIISTMALLISNLVDHGMDIQSAIEAPRINNYRDGPLKIEDRFSADVQASLVEKGHELEVKKSFDLYFGGAQGIVIDPETGLRHGGADPRRDGQAMGY
ncbi:MAG: gamma-glutamyltransferase [Gammaproteobacteria bacterium]|nr:gamma-glutamyltransferase [Gammaproteobacteria bacterium]MBT8050315.1 gamma-glutamyltransferase [Gammaproteobacteria bacterium]NNJ79772.1 gamma-glutamyltransferase [Xanthomonadales bacterium]